MTPCYWRKAGRLSLDSHTNPAIRSSAFYRLGRWVSRIGSAVKSVILQVKDRSQCALTLGIQDKDFEKFRLVKAAADVRLVCVDTSNGYTKFFVDRVKGIHEEFPDVTITAGNVATPEMVQELLISGATDIVKIGIGAGSVCTTRVKTAVGYPQLSAIIRCADAAHGHG